MIGTIALLGTLLTTTHQDKINFAHVFTAGQTVAYDFNLKGGGDQGEMEVNASLSILIGDKADKGTNVTLTPKSMKMSVNGQEMDRGSGAGDTKFTLDEHGMPDTMSMNGDSAILTLPLILTYLPNKELEVGESFDINVKNGDTTYKGTGKFEKMETGGEKPLPQLSVKAVLGTGDGHDGNLDYTVSFDQSTGRIVLIKGTAILENQEFKFTLTKK